jgi:hypothetical protein
MPLYNNLPCSAILYRGMRSKKWIDREKEVVLPAAFLRRPIDTDGLSTNLASACTIDDARSKLNPCHGVVSLHTGHIRDIGLDVEQDSPDHANIIGVPLLDEDDVEAERLAGLLAKQSRIQWLPNLTRL